MMKFPRKIAFTGVLLLLALGAGFLWQRLNQPPKTSAQSILVSEDHYTFPPSNDTLQSLEHSFVFKNVSGKAVTVSEVQTSCSCALALMSSKSILPNETAELKVALDVTKIRGLRTAWTMVQYDDGSITKLRLTASIWSNAQFVPYSFLFPSKDVSLRIYKLFPSGITPAVDVTRAAVNGQQAPVQAATTWKEIAREEGGVRYLGTTSFEILNLKSSPTALVFRFSDGEIQYKDARLQAEY
jgi:hypothetical protein